MLCKLEGNAGTNYRTYNLETGYVSYDEVVQKNALKLVEEVQFSWLKEDAFRAAAAKVDWNGLANLTTMRFSNTDLENYRFSTSLPKLQVLDLDQCDVKTSATLDSLLEQAPIISRGEGGFTWDDYSALGWFRLGEEKEEAAFKELTAKVEKIKALQRSKAAYSGETMVHRHTVSGTRGFDSDETDSLYDDRDRYASSQSDYSNEDEMVAKVIPEVMVQYQTRDGRRSVTISEFDSLDKTTITNITIDAQGKDLFRMINLADCSSLEELTIQNALIKGPNRSGPPLPSLERLYIKSCSVDERGVSYFLKDNHPTVMLTDITKEDGSLFDASEDEALEELNELDIFKEDLKSQNRNITFGLVTSATETPAWINARLLNDHVRSQRGRRPRSQIDDAESEDSFEVVKQMHLNEMDSDTLSNFSGDSARLGDWEFSRTEVDPKVLDDLSEAGDRRRRTTSQTSAARNMGFSAEYDLWDGVSISDDSIKIVVTQRANTIGKAIATTTQQTFSVDEWNLFTRLTKSEFETIEIIGGGSGSADVIAALDWSDLDGVTELTFQNATVSGALPQKLLRAGCLEHVEHITFSNCAVSPEALKSLRDASSDLTSIDIEGQISAVAEDNEWREWDKREYEAIDEIVSGVNDSPPFLLSPQQRSPQRGANASRVTPPRRSPNLGEVSEFELERLPTAGLIIKVKERLGDTPISYTLAEWNKLYSKTRAKLEYMSITGSNYNERSEPEYIDWSNLSRLKHLHIERAMLGDIYPPDTGELESLETVTFKDCDKNDKVISAFRLASLKDVVIDVLSSHDNTYSNMRRMPGQMEEDSDELLGPPRLSELRRNLTSQRNQYRSWVFDDEDDMSQAETSDRNRTDAMLGSGLKTGSRRDRNSLFDEFDLPLDSLSGSRTSEYEAERDRNAPRPPPPGSIYGGVTYQERLDRLRREKRSAQGRDAGSKHPPTLSAEHFSELEDDNSSIEDSAAGPFHSKPVTTAGAGMRNFGLKAAAPFLSAGSPSNQRPSATLGTRHGPHHAPNRLFNRRGPMQPLSSAHIEPERGARITHHYKGSLFPEATVQSEHSRAWINVVQDVVEAHKLIQTHCPNAKSYQLSGEVENGVMSITYQERRSTIPILDADKDTVKVHKGWGKVDTKTPLQVKATIILKSLGIPPCPPDIDITAKEGSRLGAAIREEFTRLQEIDKDEEDIVVHKHS